MKPVIFDFPTSSSLGKKVRELIGGEEGEVLVRNFPDGESYLRIESDVKGRDVIVNATLFHPNDWILNLFFLADALKLQGATRVGLLAPYLSYMRQDKVFQPGEALTSKTFANLLSTYFSYLVTVAPHLHRYHNLGDIYSIHTTVVKATPLIAEWIRANVENPFLIGPDEESVQWVKEIAGEFPYIVLKKIRYEDGRVEISWPEIKDVGKKTLVLIDDIISSGATMLQAIHHLKDKEISAPTCIAIHAIFGENSYQKLKDLGVKEIVTCNSISHPSNQIDLSPLLAQALTSILSEEIKA
ncbi:MAG: ribose-phosphate diphosphokinase [Alphaproteobacteria bacterium]|nr:ribose-phosphate diphosphokinase [Alphaproteobacteria bacterium]